MLNCTDCYILYKFLQSLSVYLRVRYIVFTMVTHPYISAKNKDIDTKLSGYDPWGLPSTSTTSRMTLSSKSPVRNNQGPPSTPMKDPPILDPILIMISKQNFQGIFLWVIQGQTRSSMTSRMTLSSKSPVRNPQRPPSSPMMDPSFLTHF